jgi:hypothetical protein
MRALGEVKTNLSFTLLPFGRRAGDEGLPDRAIPSPHPNPLPMGEGVRILAPFFLCRLGPLPTLSQRERARRNVVKHD